MVGRSQAAGRAEVWAGEADELGPGREVADETAPSFDWAAAIDDAAKSALATRQPRLEGPPQPAVLPRPPSAMLRYRPGAVVEATWRRVPTADDGSVVEGPTKWELAVVENDLPHLETVLVRFKKNRAWPSAALPPWPGHHAHPALRFSHVPMRPITGMPVELPRDTVRPAIGAPVERGRRHDAAQLPWELNIFDFDGTLFRSPVLDPVR